MFLKTVGHAKSKGFGYTLARRQKRKGEPAGQWCVWCPCVPQPEPRSTANATDGWEKKNVRNYRASWSCMSCCCLGRARRRWTRERLPSRKPVKTQMIRVDNEIRAARSEARRYQWPEDPPQGGNPVPVGRAVPPRRAGRNAPVRQLRTGPDRIFPSPPFTRLLCVRFAGKRTKSAR